MGPDSVEFCPLAIATHLPFPGRGGELSGVLDVHEGSNSDKAKVRQIAFSPRSILNDVSNLSALCGALLVRYAVAMNSFPHMGDEKPLSARIHRAIASPPHAFGHTDLLRCVGGGERLDNTSLQAVLPVLLPGVLATLVCAPTNDKAAKRNARRANEQLNVLESLGFDGQQVNGGSLGVLVASYDHWGERPNQVPVAQLEGTIDLVVGCVGVSKLLSLLHGANVAVRDNSLECDTYCRLASVEYPGSVNGDDRVAGATLEHWRLHSLLALWRHIRPHSSLVRMSTGHRSRFVAERIPSALYFCS